MNKCKDCKHVECRILDKVVYYECGKVIKTPMSSWGAENETCDKFERRNNEKKAFK